MQRRGLACALLALAAGGCGDTPALAPPNASATVAEYVGSAACAGCHEAQHDAWLGSHHQLAMAVPSPTTEFSKADGRYAIRTDGPSGEMASFAVRIA